MHLVDSPNATVSNEFQDSNPGGGIAGTALEAKWHNTIQDELAFICSEAGIALDDEDNNQIVEALRTGLIIQKLRGGAADDVVLEIPAGTSVSRLQQLGAGKSINFHLVSANGENSVIRLIEGGGADQAWSIALDSTDGSLRFASSIDADEAGAGSYLAKAWIESDGNIITRQGYNRAANGYAKQLNGMVTQWGQRTTSVPHNASGTIVFPVSFPNACRVVLITPHNDQVGGGVWIAVDTKSAGSFDWFAQYHNTGGQIDGFDWFAFGY